MKFMLPPSVPAVSAIVQKERSTWFVRGVNRAKQFLFISMNEGRVELRDWQRAGMPCGTENRTLLPECLHAFEGVTFGDVGWQETLSAPEDLLNRKESDPLTG